MTVSLSHPWDAYLELQETESRITKIGHRERAGDDKMTAFLDAVADGTLPDDSDAIAKKMVNLEVNRQKKYRRREQLLEEWAESKLVDHYFPNEMVNAIETREQVDAVKLSLAHREWRILWALANGSEFSMVASDEKTSVAALKMEVSRLRRKLRKSLTS
jgi:DNA-binding NarL/FixJ family response regulator